MLATTLGSIALVVAVLGVISRLLAQSTASPALAGGGGGCNSASYSAGDGGAGQTPGGGGGGGGSTKKSIRMGCRRGRRRRDGDSGVDQVRAQ